MELSEINPYIRYASIQRTHIPKLFDSICYDCRLFYIKAGNGRIVANDRTYSFAEHYAFFFPSGTRYHFYMNRDCEEVELYVINFDPTNDFRHISNSLGIATEKDFDPSRLIQYPLPEPFSDIFSKKAPDLEEPLRKITEEFLMQDALYKETASALLKFCLISLVRDYGRSGSVQRIAPVLDYIHQNFYDTSLSNKTIAEAFNYHPYYLSQLIKQNTGKTLHQYLLAYRLKMAKRLLTTTDDPIDSVSWKTGFLSTAYFIKVFKSHFGITPGSYRKNHLHFLL